MIVAPACDCERQARDDNWEHSNKCPVAKALRQEWCTPKWLADLIGTVNLDPCSNERSNITALLNVVQTLGDDGLLPQGFFRVAGQVLSVPDRWRVFCNPPYGNVTEWVKAYRHTRFAFLLRWDPSTVWFRNLHDFCTHIWHPGERIQFEPPPRIRASTNPFPHALYLRDPDPALLDRLQGRGGYIHKVN